MNRNSTAGIEIMLVLIFLALPGADALGVAAGHGLLLVIVLPLLVMFMHPIWSTVAIAYFLARWWYRDHKRFEQRIAAIRQRAYY